MCPFLNPYDEIVAHRLWGRSGVTPAHSRTPCPSRQKQGQPIWQHQSAVDILAVSITSTLEFPGGTARNLHVRLFVNGEDLLDLVKHEEEPHARSDPRRRVAGGYAGLPPARVLPPSRHFLGQSEFDWPVDGKTILFGCDCGVPECSPLMAHVTLTDHTVTWSEFGNPNRPLWTLDQLGPFTFDRSQYEAALYGAQHR